MYVCVCVYMYICSPNVCPTVLLSQYSEICDCVNTKMVIIFENGNMKNHKNSTQICPLSIVYKILTKPKSKHQKEILDENQPRMQATTDHITSKIC